MMLQYITRHFNQNVWLRSLILAEVENMEIHDTQLNAVKYLTQEELVKLFAQIKSKRDKAMFNLVYKYGLRASEVGLIRINDIDLIRSRIIIWRLKGGVSGEYGIFSDSQKLLKSYLRERENDFNSILFLSRNNNPISRKTIFDLFRKYGRKAKLPKGKIHPHILRHSIAAHMLDSGQTLENVKYQLGHRYIQSTDIYGSISSNKQKQIHLHMEKAREIVNFIG